MNVVRIEIDDDDDDVCSIIAPATPPVEVATTEPSLTVEAAPTQKDPLKAKPPETVAKPVEVARTGPLTTVPDMPATQSAPKPASADCRSRFSRNVDFPVPVLPTT